MSLPDFPSTSIGKIKTKDIEIFMRDLFILEENNVILYDDVSLSQLQENLSNSKGLFWLDLDQITDEDTTFLEEFKEIGAHPSSIKACREISTRSCSTVFQHHIFMVFNIQENLNSPPIKLGIFLAPNYLITIHPTPLDILQEVKSQIQQDPHLMRSTDLTIALIMEAICDHQDSLVSDLTAETTKTEQVTNAQWIYDMQCQLISMVHQVKPQSEIVNSLYTGKNLSLQSEAVIQLQEVFYQFRNMVEILTRQWEMLNNASATVRSNRLEGIEGATKRLTVLIGALLPLILISTIINLDQLLWAKLLNLDLLAIGFLVVLLVGIIFILTSRKNINN